MTNRERFLAGHRFRIEWTSAVYQSRTFKLPPNGLAVGIWEDGNENSCIATVSEVMPDGFVACREFLGTVIKHLVLFTVLTFLDNDK